MFSTKFLYLAVSVAAQMRGNLQPEEQPPLTYEECHSDVSSCSSQDSSVVLDANWRWLHVADGFTNCFGSGGWLCDISNGDHCETNCMLEGVSAEGYSGTYGVHTDLGDNGNNQLDIDYVTVDQHGTNVGARTYLMEAGDNTMYKNVQFAGPNSYQEFSFDVDVSAIPCGLNGALYLSEMNMNGDRGVGSNTSGAEYGTGYCDAQCPRDIKYIDGEFNHPTSGTSGAGRYGTCCMEMDIWEANSQSQALTPHNCARNPGPEATVDPLIRCEGETECGDGNHRFEGVCDKNGCDLNPYRFASQMGLSEEEVNRLRNFYGPGSQYTVDTTQPMKVVTQFVQDANQDVQEIRRLYVQNGQVIHSPSITITDPENGNQPFTFDSITDDMCTITKNWMGESDHTGARVDDWARLGGMAQMNKAFRKGMVLVMSLWDDTSDARMQWLDATYPLENPRDGDFRGRCTPAPTQNYHEDTRLMYGPESTRSQAAGLSQSGASGYQYPAKVAFSNIRFGRALGSTFDSSDTPIPSTPVPDTPVTTAAPVPSTPGAQQWLDQCGGDFGNCADLENLVCVSSGAFSECRKTAAVVGFSQRTERCDHVAAGCGVGLRCNSDDNHCERDPTFVPPVPVTTAAPVTTQGPAPTPEPVTTRAPNTSQAPVTTRAPVTTVPPTPTQRPAPSGSPLWGQCGGNNWTGPTSCAEGRCQISNEWYSQCVPARSLGNISETSEIIV